MNNKANLLARDLITFIDNSPVSYFAAANIIKELENSGYRSLNEGDKWKLEPGHKYYLQRNNSAVIAFQLGSEKPWQSGFNIVGAHTDSPHLKLKNESLTKSAGCLKVSVETYGGGINSTWLDRDLSLAGRISINTENGIQNRLVDFKRAVGSIPNLAIHLNREANAGFEYNKQTHLPVILFGTDKEIDEKNYLKELVAVEADVQVDSILEMDLFFYDTQKGAVIGLDQDMIAVGRLDNLAMCHCIYKSLTEADNPQQTNIGVFFDNEEIGSRTMMGADSNFLSSLLERITFALDGDLEDGLRAKHHSFLISADGAHALHPNFTDKHDKSYAPLLNQGPVIKMSANFRYATTAETAGRFINLCNKAGVPYQKMANRSDLPSGSTIGPTSSASLGINTIDVGNPMFAMHSIRESQGTLDHYYMTKVICEFYK
ncbi:M18 family aminopeptidase [Psychromonas ossibalaenae]|uniref:M18 family aminopeptidase n=1 Tax=Psychromonas ossibalaenae TaxID=444922 RepID=UPI0003645B98|nr:M18 family aminopeptidase [Psychromonas ossibalaenae]